MDANVVELRDMTGGHALPPSSSSSSSPSSSSSSSSSSSAFVCSSVCPTCSAPLSAAAPSLIPSSSTTPCPSSSVTPLSPPPSSSSSSSSSSPSPSFSLVSSTDFFYPLVEDPFIQGEIAAANVLSDLYAMGVPRAHSLLMLLGSPLSLSPPPLRSIIARRMAEGFAAAALRAGTPVGGGQTVLNPWPLIGGVATAVVPSASVLSPFFASPGDVLLLTKPLGTQVAVNARQWAKTPAKWEKYGPRLREQWANYAYLSAIKQMRRMNAKAAELMMRKGRAKAATDVTGFGLLGHSLSLLALQRAPVSFLFHSLPCLRYTPLINRTCWDFGLLEGRSAETSGGLLIVMGEGEAREMIEEMRREEGEECWIVGRVVEGNREVLWSDKMNVFDVDTEL